MKLPLDKVLTDGGTQARAALNEDVVAEYAEAIIGGADLPPVVVFQDGKKYWLADGFHRFHAHRKANAESIDADVRVGTKRDAILHSVGANSLHGLRRSNEDKRCAVRTLLNDREWGAWSDRQIADACGVSHPFVAAIRNPDRATKQQAQRDATSVHRVVPAQASDLAVGTPSVESDSTGGMLAAAPIPADSGTAVLPTEAAGNDHLPGDVGGDDAHEEAQETELEQAHRQIDELTDLLHGFETATSGEQAAASEIRRLQAQLRTVESQRDQAMLTCNEVKRQVVALQRENKRLLAKAAA